MNHLLDTNVLSELRKGARGHPGVGAWFSSLDPRTLFVSVVALGELWRGVEQIGRRDAPSSAVLERWVLKIERDFENRILPITPPIAKRWGRLSSEQPMPTEDSLIAATALVHRLVVATRNVRDFERSGAAVFNPWEYQLAQ